MAFTETLHDKSSWRKEVTSQISTFLPGIRHLLPNEIRDLRLAESFKVWELDTQKLLKATPDAGLESLTNETERWHHQVFVNELAQVHAESRLEDGDKVHVYQLSVSPLASKIEQAINLVDSFPDHVRFLVAPPFRLFAFWLVESRQVYLLDAPATFIQEKPYVSQFLSDGDFITLLRADLKAALEKTQDA